MLFTMPRRDPFTAVCQQFAVIQSRRLADLHAHTTASDGDFTPSQLVAKARTAKLAAIAVTDHDTVAGVAEAMAAASAFVNSPIEIVSGVELSVSFREREIHVLGLFVDPEHSELNRVCREVCESRRTRFHGYVKALNQNGFAIPAHLIERTEAMATSLGRRHIASLLVESRLAYSRHAAFTKMMSAVADCVPPKRLIPISDAIRTIRDAEGLSILAHPPGHFDESTYAELASFGLDGIETRYPSASNLQTDFLIERAKQFGFAVSAGSDCHGPEAGERSLGSFGLWPGEFAELAQRAGRTVKS